MLSFLISNAIIVSQALTGMTPYTTEYDQNSTYVNIDNVQSLTVTAKNAQTVSRDGFTVENAPRVEVAFLRPQIATQSLPASNSSLVSSAAKYLGMFADCTWLVEQALRDIGYGIGDVGPMGFASVGVNFFDPNQVQPGDIMMRGNHVAIYAGDGLAIQGGYNGSVVIVTDSPSNYGSFVRIG